MSRQTQSVNYSKNDGPPVSEIITVSESVSINGKGKKRTTDENGITTYPAYEKATGCYDTLWGGAEDRIKNLYPEGTWAKENGQMGELNKSSTSKKSNRSPAARLAVDLFPQVRCRTTRIHLAAERHQYEA